MLLPELWVDIGPDGLGGDVIGGLLTGIGPNPGGEGRSSIGIGFPARCNLIAS